MHKRLAILVDIYAKGRQVEFAQLMGWSPQYLHRLLAGEGGIGLRPIIALLEKFPAINPRWLILGKGLMIESPANELKSHLLAVLSLEKYMPVMTPEELQQFAIEGRTHWNEETIIHWSEALAEKESAENPI